MDCSSCKEHQEVVGTACYMQGGLPWRSVHSLSEDVSQYTAVGKTIVTGHGNKPWQHKAWRSRDTANLDITEGCKLALGQSLDHHQWRHQLLLIDVLQDLSNVTFALLTG